MNLEKHKELSKIKHKANNRFFKTLKKVKPKVVDSLFHSNHKKVFDYTNFMQCANCFKTTGPLFTNKDIQRI